jgi:hypothetical protein
LRRRDAPGGFEPIAPRPRNLLSNTLRLAVWLHPPTVAGCAYSGFFSAFDKIPITPSRNSITLITKIVPWMTVTQAPNVAR